MKALHRVLRPLLSHFSPGGREGQLAILIYHRVLPAPDPLRPGEPDVSRFEWQMETLASLCNVLPLSEAVFRLREGSLPPRAVAITFDDGYADNLEVATPVLRRWGLPSTLFVATGFLDGGIMWNDVVLEAFARLPSGRVDLSSVGLGVVEIRDDLDRRRHAGSVLKALKYRPLEERVHLAHELADAMGVALPRDLMLDRNQLVQLSRQDWEIGGHTVNHPILSVLSPEEGRREIVGGKAELERILGRPVTLFAYPNGRPGEDYTSEHVKILPALGFEAAVSTHGAVNDSGSDPFQLARIHVWDRTPLRFALRLADAYRRGAPTSLPTSVRVPT